VSRPPSAPRVSAASGTHRTRVQFVASPVSAAPDAQHPSARSQVAAPAALAKVAKQLAARPRGRTAKGTSPPSGNSDTRSIRSHMDRASELPDERAPLDVATAARSVSLELIGGRSHYERVIAAVLGAHTSVWIATANVKSLMVEDGRAAPGRRRTVRRSNYVSIVALLADLADRGVELRLLHAELPSGPFREELAAHPRLVAGGLALARCPRVHMKTVIVDGALLYLGSANWTGAGLGAKGTGRRNFELGIVTDDGQLLDQVQGLYERVWSGAECAGCKLKDVCPGPLSELHETAAASAGSAPRKMAGASAGSAPRATSTAASRGARSARKTRARTAT